MLTPRSLAFLQGGRTLRRARIEAQRQLQAEPALRLQPSLIDIPLGTLPDPASLLAQPGGLAVCGPPASGRSLALLQLRSRWVEAGPGPAVALALAADDVPNLSPRAIVAGAIHRAGLPAAYAEGGKPLLLLLDDWEDLPADRRSIWRGYALAAATWPVGRVAVGLPAGESWPGLRSIAMAAPDDVTLADWLGRLLPGHDPAPIMAALGREPLASLRSNVGDLLLLALIYPICGLPTSRAQLYEQAYALARPILDEAQGQLSVGRATLRHYRLARGLVGGADFDSLADLPAREIAAVAPLAVELLGDARPVIDLLWAGGAPGPRQIHGLAACLRERPGDLPAQGLRLIELLATTDSHQALRALITPGLPELFASVGPAELQLAARTLAQMAEHWPATLATNLLLALIDRPGASAELRWAAADLLAAQDEPPTGLANRPGVADDLAMATRAYVIAMTAPAERPRLLDAALRPGLEALLAGAGGAERQSAAAAALLADDESPSELRAMALAGVPADAASASLLQRALADRGPALRRSAMAVLSDMPPADALPMLAQALAAASDDADALGDLLAAAARVAHPSATGLIARQALSEGGRIDLRITALRLLASRAGGAALLQRFLGAAGMPDPLRAAAAQLLGVIDDHSAIPPLRHTLLGGGPPLLRRAAAQALGEIARRPSAWEAAIAAMIEAIARPDPDATLIAQVAAALGAAGAVAAIPALSTLLSPDRPASLRAGWLAAIPALAHAPAELWPAIPLDPITRSVLLDSLATGATAEDQPSSLAELGDRQAALTAGAAAQALAVIAERRPDQRAAICARIRRAILGAPSTQPPTSLLAALTRAARDQVVAEFAALLDSPEASPALRWATLDQLTSVPSAADWLRERLRVGDDDLFTQGKLVATLGALGDRQAAPQLCALLADPAAEPHLRSQAAVALGRIGGAEAGAALLGLVRSPAAPARLRAAAAAALPQPLTEADRHTLRQIARIEGGTPALAVALAVALARAGDRESLPLLLREAQGERIAEAISAIEAMAELGDQGAAPVLVRISQSAIAAPGVRLAAVAALLQIDGPAHLPLLRGYLDSPIPPLRLRAHQILAAIDPRSPQLLTPASDVGAPLALRLTALKSLVAVLPDLNLVESILLHSDEPAQLRICAADALSRADSATAARALVAALGSAGPPLLHRRCIDVLGTLAAAGDLVAQAGLAGLAQDSDSPAEIRHWAATIILDHTLQRNIA